MKPRNYILALLTNESKEVCRVEFEYHDKERNTYNPEQETINEFMRT